MSAPKVDVRVLNYDPSDPDKMRLPFGKECGDCTHIYRCKAIFGHVETDTYCDWSPSRFRARIVEDAAEEVSRQSMERAHGVIGS